MDQSRDFMPGKGITVVADTSQQLDELEGPWDRLRPPARGWTAKDLDRIPDLPPHTQLIDGSLVFPSYQTTFHALVSDLLGTSLRRYVPPEFGVSRQQTITLGIGQRPEPDVFVVHRDGMTGLDQNDFSPAHVVLVIEVESPDSELRDRHRKPDLYAEAGIAHFWRVENHSSQAVVITYELGDHGGEYKLTGEHRGQLEVDVPFPIEIDLTEIHRL